MSSQACSLSVLFAKPVWGVLGASLLSAPCRSRTHGSCPCSSREISSGLKTRNPAVKVAKKDTALAWLGMQLRAQTPWFPGVKGQRLLTQAEPLTKASEAEVLGMAVLSGSVQLLRLDSEGCLDSQPIPVCLRARIPEDPATKESAKNRLLHPRKREARHCQHVPHCREQGHSRG